jgi:hypothetical protein
MLFQNKYYDYSILEAEELGESGKLKGTSE